MCGMGRVWVGWAWQLWAYSTAGNVGGCEWEWWKVDEVE